MVRGQQIRLRNLKTEIFTSGRVLRVANGFSFATRSRVATLSRAVPLIGANGVLSVALSFSLVRGRRRTQNHAKTEVVPGGCVPGAPVAETAPPARARGTLFNVRRWASGRRGFVFSF